MERPGLHWSQKWDFSSVNIVRDKCIQAGWPPQVWPARLPAPAMPPHHGETLWCCKAKSERQVLPKTPCHPPWPGPNLQRRQEGLVSSSDVALVWRLGFFPASWWFCQTVYCCSWKIVFWVSWDASGPLCTVNCVGNPHWGRLIAVAELWLLSHEIPKLIAYIITSLFLKNIGGFGFLLLLLLFVLGIIYCDVIPSGFVLFLWLKNLFLNMLLWFYMNYWKEIGEGIKWYVCFLFLFCSKKLYTEIKNKNITCLCLTLSSSHSVVSSITWQSIDSPDIQISLNGLTTQYFLLL